MRLLPSAPARRRRPLGRRLRERAVAPDSPFVKWPAAVDSPAYLHETFWSVDESHGIAKAALLRLPTLEYRPLLVDLLQERRQKMLTFLA
jgi:hypothetical protein